MVYTGLLPELASAMASAAARVVAARFGLAFDALSNVWAGADSPNLCARSRAVLAAARRHAATALAAAPTTAAMLGLAFDAFSFGARAAAVLA